MDGWQVERSVGPAHDFHHRDLGRVHRPTIWIHRVERPALVLGSSQSDDLVDRPRAARLGVEVCRRRSGGGLVLVDPLGGCWIDVVITPDSPLWDADVNRSFLWVGEVWANALHDLGIDRLFVHRDGILRREAGRFLCFAGVGPGEVLRTPSAAVGRPTGTDATQAWKVVGLSQRRQRNAARIQGLFVTETDLELTRSLITAGRWPDDLDDELRIGLGGDPAGAERRAVDPDATADRFLARLPAP